MLSDAELTATVGVLPYVPEMTPFVHEPPKEAVFRHQLVAKITRELDWRYAARTEQPLPGHETCTHEEKRKLDGGFYCKVCAAAFTVEITFGEGAP